jgi:oligopeptide/dipeptide ABC transporter ATP-binding protein
MEEGQEPMTTTLVESSPLVEVKSLTTQFRTRTGRVRAVTDVSFSISRGEILALVGESGCGKSTTALSVARLLPEPAGSITDGSINLGGTDIVHARGRSLRSVRGTQLAMVFQDPMTSLNPVLTVGKQIGEPLRAVMRLDRQAAHIRAVELLEWVGIPDPESCLASYPHQLSGGMRQRVMIAIALSCAPQLLIADEPTTALDVTIQAQILDLIRRLRDELHMGVLFITHDLGVVAELADRVAVMYAGRIVEEGTPEQILTRPAHPYTAALLKSVPRLGRKTASRRLPALAGRPPDLSKSIEGCPFAPRCANAIEACRTEPELLAIGGAEAPLRTVACWNPESV